MIGKKTVILRAPLLTSSGYGTHSRQIFRWLKTRSDVEVVTQPVPWGITSWLINPDDHDGLIGDIMSTTSMNNSGADISIQLQLPNEWNPHLAKVNIGVSAFVETDTCNPAWLECCNAMDAIVVPSKHVAKCIINTGGITTPLYVIPESFYDCIEKSPDPIDLDFSTSFNFLIFGQLTGFNPENDRKNIFYTIKWLCETFKDDEDVGIVIKTNSGKNTRIDRENTAQLLKKLLGEVRLGPLPRVHFLHGTFSQQEIASIYQHSKIKALVSLTRGEGFGLPLLEAAASGLPIIATNWSGHKDFLDHGQFLDVKYQLEEIHESRIDNHIFMKGARWAQPLEEDAKKRFTKFRRASSIPTRWAAELQEQILEKFSQEAIERIYDEKLKEFFDG